MKLLICYLWDHYDSSSQSQIADLPFTPPWAASRVRTCPVSDFQSKPRGIRAARKLKTHRRNQKWADKDYKRAHLGNEYAKPFAGCSHAKGIVLEKMLDNAIPPIADVVQRY
jgi:hypothetical protein